jgi:hypothetical protein
MSIGGSGSNVLATRLAGVKVAVDSTPSQHGTPNTVTGLVEATVVFVWHNDVKGNSSLAMYFKVGDDYYSTPDTTEWCGRLRPMAEWMRKGLEGKARVSVSAEQLAKTDSVDVLGPAKEEVAGDTEYETFPQA